MQGKIERGGEKEGWEKLRQRKCFWRECSAHCSNSQIFGDGNGRYGGTSPTITRLVVSLALFPMYTATLAWETNWGEMIRDFVDNTEKGLHYNGVGMMHNKGL